LKQEVEAYLGKNLVSLKEGDEDKHHSKWWQNNQEQYKHRAAIAKQYLSTHVSSACSERMFSKANRLLDERRPRFIPQNVTRILFFMAHLDCFKRSMKCY
jgi:hypothetical protein